MKKKLNYFDFLIIVAIFFIAMACNKKETVTPQLNHHPNLKVLDKLYKEYSYVEISVCKLNNKIVYMGWGSCYGNEGRIIACSYFVYDLEGVLLASCRAGSYDNTAICEKSSDCKTIYSRKASAPVDIYRLKERAGD